MKPLSQKTLEKKYAELGLSQKNIALLHDYYNCFANLYGIIMVKEAWDIFRHYEGVGLLHKKDFVAFSSIVQREAGHLYTILELKEVYSEETSQAPADRLIVHNDLICPGYGKYTLLYKTEEHRADKPYYLPEDKQKLLSFTTDRFYLSDVGRNMIRFLGNLKSDGHYKDYNGKTIGNISDIDGNPVKGKRLSDFVLCTQSERFDIEYHKSEAKKERLRREYKTTALDKIADRIRIEIQTDGYITASPADTIEFLTEYMDRELGAGLTMGQLEQFMELHTKLNNNSHLWLNCGWSPHGLSRHMGRGVPPSISIGPNLKRMFENGEMNRAEFEQSLKKLGVKLINQVIGNPNRRG